MDTVLELSIESVSSGGGPFAAAIVKNEKIIATGTNRVTIELDPSAHAEIVAIRNACKILGSFDLNGCVLYTSCEPCPMCLGAIYWSHISKIYYCNTQYDAKKIGFDDSFIYNEFAKSPNERLINATHVCEENAISAFRLWEEKNDKILY